MKNLVIRRIHDNETANVSLYLQRISSQSQSCRWSICDTNLIITIHGNKDGTL